MKKNKKNAHSLPRWFAALVAMLLPGLASAAPQLFEVSCSDRSMSDYLVPIFGSLFAECGGSAGALEKAFAVLNAGALTIGGMIAAYTLVVGTMQTAHDGELLGKKWSSMWIPIRTVLGVGMAVPISGGYCVAQLLVGFLISQSIGLANGVWGAYIDAFTTPQGMAPKSRLPNVTELATGMLVSQVCLAAYNEVANDASVIMPAKMAASAPGPGVRAFGLAGGSECGAIVYQKMGLSGGGVVSATSFDPASLSVVEQAHMTAMAAMEAKLATTAQKVVASYTGGAAPDVAADMNAAIGAYQQSVAGAAANVFGNQDAMQAFVEGAKNDGWAYAGALYMKAVAMQSAVSESIAHVPTVVKPNQAILSRDIAPYFVILDAQMRKGATSALASGATGNAAAQLGNTGSPLAQGAQKVMNWIFGGDWIYSAIQADTNRSALMSVKDFGDYLMTGAEAGLAGGVLMTAGAEAVRAENSSIWGNVAGFFSVGATTAIAGAASGAMATVGWLMIGFCSAMFAFGAAIAIYLPMAPFLIYFGAFLGWLLLCAEAVVAAPLWGVMHMLPHGDGVAGGARQGYMLLLGVLLRPVLIVLGFIMSLSILNVAVQGFNGIFFPVFKMSMAGSVIGLGSSIAMVAIYMGAMLWLFHFVFGITAALPDKLLRWIGGGHEQLGEAASGLSKTGQAGAESVGRHVSDASSKTLQGITAQAQMAARRKGGGAAPGAAPGEAPTGGGAGGGLPGAMQEKKPQPPRE